MSGGSALLLYAAPALRYDDTPVKTAKLRLCPVVRDPAERPPNTVIIPAATDHIRGPAASLPVDGFALAPLFVLLPAATRIWSPYTLMSYTGDDLVYVALPGDLVRGDPRNPGVPAARATDLSTRHRAHGVPLNNHRCWFRNARPGLEIEHKFTLPEDTDIWRLAVHTHDLRQVIRNRFGLQPAWGATYRRVRYNVMVESLATGHVFSIMYDRCTTASPNIAPLTQAEVEYIRSRALRDPLDDDLDTEFQQLINWTRDLLTSQRTVTAEDNLSKLTWLRQH